MSDLAKRQADLVQALVAGGPLPEGFDTDALRATADALLRKRASEVASRDPDLAYRLGSDFRRLFREWAAARPKITTAADTLAFRQEMTARGLLPEVKKQSWFRRIRLR